MKKAGLIGLILVMTLTLFAGCANNSNNENAGPSTEPTATPAGEETPAGPEKNTFTTMLYSNPSWPYNAYWTVWDWIEEKTGAIFDVQVPPGEIGQALSLAIASDEMPDLAYGFAGIQKGLGDQGALVDFSDHLDAMPNLKAFIDKYPDLVDTYRATDGSLYMTPVEGTGIVGVRSWLYRQDIFEKHNLKVPTTWDEFYTVLVELKKLYPDSIPLMYRNGLGGLLGDMAPSFDTYSQFYPDAEKKIKYAPLEDNFKKMIEMLHKFYEAGLLAKDFLSVDTNRWVEAISTSNSFVTNDYAVRIDQFNNEVRKGDPETKFNLAFMAPPAGWTGGQQLLFNNTTPANGYMVNAKSKKINELLKVLDWFYTEEARTLVSWGKEGETYELVNGEKQYVTGKFNTFEDFRNKTGISTDGTYLWMDMTSRLPLISEGLATAYVEAEKYLRPLNNMASTKPEQNDLFYTTWGEILTHTNAEVASFIIGTRDLSTWDAFKQEIIDLGIDKVIKAHQENYDEMISKK